ncbi:hypothetical protein HanXRQr2_Chr08g0328321 [Helianthus annuus]|uniref:Uncharacterized protein n=2 Tax=Helianthus annuus TaxID=4232 RepID=A0A9K3ID58_HELAN|nr:hypothetical protein HanXRQr2_Chr08g0328321 [Helianthus annuus]KAJ0545871.1 hypothetical protein HanIR_Chr08g0354581 [Helianthus annuus]KAJ0922548.1 hypothetical protein HanPSC8_Chr05g0205111 [Helianthus annuus]
MSKLLQYCGMCDMLKELLIHRYFSKAVCGSLEVPELEIIRACRKIEKLKLVIKEFFKEKDEEKERLNGIIVGLFVVNEKDKVDKDTMLNRMSEVEAKVEAITVRKYAINTWF